MALHALQNREPDLSSEVIAARIQAYVDRGDYPYIAAEKVIKDLCREGRQEELLTLFWPPVLMDVWEHAKNPRNDAKLAALERGRRRVRLEALGPGESILESLQYVDGHWVRVGNMDRAACKKAARSLKRDAIATATRARFFHALSERLAVDQKVREAFDDAALSELMAEAGK